MKQFDVKELFKRFVFGYISSGHTQTEESEEELKRLIVEFINTIDDEDCFTYPALCDIIAYVEHNISDENKGFYHYWANKHSYRDQLEKFIRYIINRRLRIESSDESDENGI